MKLNEIKQLQESTILLSSAADIKDWLSQLPKEVIDISKCVINSNGTVDVVDSFVDLDDACAILGLDGFPVKFGDVGGSFNCESNNLTDLLFAPTHCTVFNIKNNKLTNLVGSPKCSTLNAGHNLITSLEGCPHSVSVLRVADNPIKSLVGVDEHIHSMANVADTNVGGHVFMSFDSIDEGGIGLILIPGLNRLNNRICGSFREMPKPFQIIEKYIGRPDDIFECQNELIEKGYEAFAIL